MSEIGDQIRELQREGHGVSAIAHRLRVAQATVRYHLRPSLGRIAPEALAAPLLIDPAARSQVETRARVGRLLDEGLSRSDIARRLGVSKSTVSYHARRLGAEIDERCARRYDWEAVQAFHDAGNGVRACIRAFGFSGETWHAAARRGDLAPRTPFLSLDEVFAAGVPRNRGHLKQRLLRAGLKDGRCERCGIDRWLDGPLSLALHHVNGVRDDNRIENLQLLCPNCHSQTENFGGRRRRTDEIAA